MRNYTKIANYFIGVSNTSGSLITNLKLQKLVYYAEAWHLANFNESIVDEDFEAWVHGPVVRRLYGEYRGFGWKPIIQSEITDATHADLVASFPERTRELLQMVTDEYFSLPAYQLERLTHNEDPWRLTRGDLPEDAPSDSVIDKVLMQQYYRKFIV